MSRELSLVLLTCLLITSMIMISRELSSVLLMCLLTYWHDNKPTYLTGMIIMSGELSLVLLTCLLTHWHDDNEWRAKFGVTYLPTYSLA